MFVEYPITGQLVIMSPLFLGKWYSRLILLFTLSFVWRCTVLMYVRDALVATVGYGIGVFLEMYSRILEQTKVVGFTRSEVGRYDSFCPLVDYYLTLGGVPFLFAGVVPPLFFLGAPLGTQRHQPEPLR
jgi:hypothetical protein